MKKNMLFICIILLEHGCQKNLINSTLLHLFVECRKQNDRSEIKYLTYNWKTPINLDGYDGPKYNPSFGYSMTYDGDALINDQNRGISRIDSKTGGILWTWSDMYQPETEDVSLSYPMMNGSLYSWVRGGRHYCIDMESGETKFRWRDLDGISFGSRSFRIDNDLSWTYYVNTTENEDGTISSKIISKTMLGEFHEVFFKLPYNPEIIGEQNRVLGISRPYYF